MNIETDVSEHAPMQMIELTVVNRPPWYITYEYRGFRITYERNRNQRIARIDQDGQLRCWASDFATAVRWIDWSCPQNAQVLELAESRQARDESQKLGKVEQC